MEILTINPNNPDPKIINKATLVLKSGGVIIYPTDTCYGIGADPTNKLAVQKIIKIKKRAESKKFSLIVKDIEQIRTLTNLNISQEEILKKYLPGSFTFILTAKDRGLLNSKTLGVRIPKYPITQLLANEFNQPFITTSANLSGKPSIYSFTNLQLELLDKLDLNNLPDLVLDAGILPNSPPSTIVDLTVNPPQIIRQGRDKY